MPNSTKTTIVKPAPKKSPAARPKPATPATRAAAKTPAAAPAPKPDPSAKMSPGPKGTVTLRLKRLLKAPPERVYRCFLDPDALVKWMPPHGFLGHVHHLDAKVGGTFRMSFATINRSWGHTFGGTYLELKPYERIVHTDKFESDDPAMQGEMRLTIEFKPVAGGTEVHITQEGIPKAVADGSPVGWGQSLDNLQRLCEQDLPF